MEKEEAEMKDRYDFNWLFHNKCGAGDPLIDADAKTAPADKDRDVDEPEGFGLDSLIFYDECCDEEEDDPDY